MELIEKLMHIQHELKAPKDKDNKFGKYKYRSCESILEAVKPLLKKYNCVLLLDDRIEEIGERVYIKATATLIDAENFNKSDMVTAGIGSNAYAREADGKTGMDMAQLTGSCSSYARKYALNGLFAIDDAKDPDTNEYHEETKPRKKDTAKEVETIFFGTASRADTTTNDDVALPFDIGGPIETEALELNALKALMDKDGITEQQVLDAFKGKYSAVDNIEPHVIQEMLLDKWDSFKKFVNKEK